MLDSSEQAPSLARYQTIDFSLNSRATSWQGNPNDRLLDVLRDDLGQTDVKCGCREGECGACSVLLDGVLVNSCLVAMGRVSGATVTTLEGFKAGELAQGHRGDTVQTERFKVLDRCFAAQGAVQCGYCTPGMILAAEALLSRNPRPTKAEVRTAISGNLCRCTGYNALVNAILDAAKEGEGLW